MKAKKILTIVFTVLASAMVVLSGIMKLTQSEQVMTKMSELGVGPYVVMLGLMEILFTVLFLFPKTMKLGFILLSCYFAGAIATDLSHGMPVTNAMMPIALVWIATFLRDSSVFLPFKQEFKTGNA